MGAIASLITSLTIVYPTIYSGTDQSKHQSSASLAFVWGIHRGPVNSPHKWPVTRKMFPFDDVIMIFSVAGTEIYHMGEKHHRSLDCKTAFGTVCQSTRQIGSKSNGLDCIQWWLWVYNGSPLIMYQEQLNWRSSCFVNCRDILHFDVSYFEWDRLTLSGKIYSKSWRKCIWKCRLERGCHLV